MRFQNKIQSTIEKIFLEILHMFLYIYLNKAIVSK